MNESELCLFFCQIAKNRIPFLVCWRILVISLWAMEWKRLTVAQWHSIPNGISVKLRKFGLYFRDKGNGGKGLERGSKMLTWTLVNVPALCGLAKWLRKKCVSWEGSSQSRVIHLAFYQGGFDTYMLFVLFLWEKILKSFWVTSETWALSQLKNPSDANATVLPWMY